MPERGLIHVHTGEGKGKTTEALGLKVYFMQFLKGPVRTRERAAPEGQPLIEMESFGGEGFVDRRRPTDEDRKLAR